VIVLKSAREIGLMRRAGHILAGLMERLRTTVGPGMSTLDIDEAVEAYRLFDTQTTGKGVFVF